MPHDERELVCAGLRRCGVDAQIAERGRPEEKIFSERGTESLGVVDIAKGPIRWVNVRKELRSSTL